MEKKENKDEKQEKGSNSCVMDLSIDGGEEKEINDKEEGNTNLLNKSFDDISNFTKKLNLKDNFENILDIDTDENFFNEENKIRSKTFAIKNSSKNPSQVK